MSNTKFHIRAELPENRFVDFSVSAETLNEARLKAQTEIEFGNGKFDVGIIPSFEWRGQVVFVNREP